VRQTLETLEVEHAAEFDVGQIVGTQVQLGDSGLEWLEILVQTLVADEVLFLDVAFDGIKHNFKQFVVHVVDRHHFCVFVLTLLFDEGLDCRGVLIKRSRDEVVHKGEFRWNEVLKFSHVKNDSPVQNSVVKF